MSVFVGICMYRQSDHMEEIRKMTGICPQHDVLFDELSPREHLQFFARIRVGDYHGPVQEIVCCFHVLSYKIVYKN